MGSDSNLIRIWRMNGCVFVRGVGVDVGVDADLDKEFFGCDVWVLSELLGDFFLSCFVRGVGIGVGADLNKRVFRVVVGFEHS